MTESLVVADDGRARCGWVGSVTDRDAAAEYRRYHDEEWGHPLHGDRALFEKLSLEAFQSGLSWITILRRRANFRRAFADFDIATVAEYDERDVERLLADAGIIRNRLKIEATISNARLTRELVAGQPGALDALMWGFATPRRAQPLASLDQIPAITTESTALSVALKTLGYRFVGPTTMYALMQSCGLVDDHVAGCWRSAGTHASERQAEAPGAGGTEP